MFYFHLFQVLTWSLILHQYDKIILTVKVVSKIYIYFQSFVVNWLALHIYNRNEDLRKVRLGNWCSVCEIRMSSIHCTEFLPTIWKHQVELALFFEQTYESKCYVVAVSFPVHVFTAPKYIKHNHKKMVERYT